LTDGVNIAFSSFYSVQQLYFGWLVGWLVGWGFMALSAQKGHIMPDCTLDIIVADSSVFFVNNILFLTKLSDIKFCT